MFEKELDRARKQLKLLLDTRQPSISLPAILANEKLHPAYRAFFKAEVEWWLHEEQAIRTSNPRFDTSADSVRASVTKLDALYFENARFDHEELNATIEAAVKTRLNFLLRPRTTLKWFVYRGEPTKPLNEVLLRLNYLTDHAYLVDGIRQWAKSRPADTSTYEILSVVEFDRIVEKTDNDAILDLSQDDFIQLLDGIYEFFADADPDSPPESVPTEAVIIYLDDKGAVPISQSLERLLYREELRTLTRIKLIDVIDTVIATMEPIQPVVEAVPPPLQTQTPLRVARFAEMLDAGTRERIIKKVFGKNSQAFTEGIQEVLESSNWKEAAAVLDRMYARRGISPDSTAAMEFAQALHRSYL